jgi:hypothetical protein
MRIPKLLAGLALAALLAGCGTSSVLRPDAAQKASDSESIIVFGINPNYTIHLAPGEKLPEGFKQSALLGAVVNGESTDGYLVAKVKPGQLLGLVSVYKKQEGNAFGTQGFTACGNRALVLQVPRAGGMYYVTDITYVTSGSRLNVRYAKRMALAAEYMRTKYPQMRGELEQLDFEFLPSLGGCGGGTVTIPIYIGR